MLSSLVLSMAVTMVPPDRSVENHAHPGHYGQPTIRRFERFPVDQNRRESWESYVRELDILWKEYRDADSTPRAWRLYNAKAWEAKRRYIYGDPYIKAIRPVDDRQWPVERYDEFPVK